MGLYGNDLFDYMKESNEEVVNEVVAEVILASAIAAEFLTLLAMFKISKKKGNKLQEAVSDPEFKSANKKFLEKAFDKYISKNTTLKKYITKDINIDCEKPKNKDLRNEAFNFTNVIGTLNIKQLVKDITGKDYKTLDQEWSKDPNYNPDVDKPIKGLMEELRKINKEIKNVNSELKKSTHSYLTIKLSTNIEDINDYWYTHITDKDEVVTIYAIQNLTMVKNLEDSLKDHINKISK